MKVVFHASEKEREQELAQCFLAGVREHGHTGEIRPLGSGLPLSGDLACMVGVKSATLWQRHREAGIPLLYFDKGYSRHRRPNSTWEYWRVSPNAHHPTGTSLISHNYPANRLMRMGLDIKPWRSKTKGPIIFAGSSAKYHEFYGMPDPTEYAQMVISEIRRFTTREIVYRPKPSWRDATPIAGARYSQNPESLGTLLMNAQCLVTHGSNACFEAMVAGVPTIILGDGVTRPLSSISLADVERPLIPHHKKRYQLLANIAYHQWTLPEMVSGEAWDTIGEWYGEQTLR